MAGGTEEWPGATTEQRNTGMARIIQHKGPASGVYPALSRRKQKAPRSATQPDLKRLARQQIHFLSLPFATEPATAPSEKALLIRLHLLTVILPHACARELVQRAPFPPRQHCESSFVLSLVAPTARFVDSTRSTRLCALRTPQFSDKSISTLLDRVPILDRRHLLPPRNKNKIWSRLLPLAKPPRAASLPSSLNHHHHPTAALGRRIGRLRLYLPTYSS